MRRTVRRCLRSSGRNKQHLPRQFDLTRAAAATAVPSSEGNRAVDKLEVMELRCLRARKPRAIKRSLLGRCPTWYVIEPLTPCQMLADSTDIGVQTWIADESRFLFDHALPLVVGRVEFIKEYVERGPEIAASAMLFDRLCQSVRMHWSATV